MVRASACGRLFVREGAVSAFPFDAVIFDMDGVLVDTEFYYQQELEKFIDYLQISVTRDELNAIVGSSHQDFQQVLVEWYKRAGQGVLEPADAEARYEVWASAYPCDYSKLLNPGVSETLAGLKDFGVRVALASSSPLNNIEEVLNACGIRDYFEFLVSGEQFKRSKPEPDIYLHAIDRLGLPATHCCCVEDSLYGITAGKRSGLTVIAKREERFGFSQDAADKIIDQLPDLLELA